MTLADYLKQLYGDKESMTLPELTQAAESCKTAKFVDLKEGGYVDEGKYTDISAKLLAANNTIKTLRDAARSFEGVDVADLQRQLDDEKAGRKKDRQEWNLRALFTGAGCTDVDYLLYKVNGKVEYEEDGRVKNQDALLEACRKDYAAQFPAQAQAVNTGSVGNFARSHGSADPQRARLEKDATDTNLPLAQRIFAREQLAAMDNRKDE